ncbi:MAG: HRDC domain-containing protein [Pirellula sp.]|jgi:ATP-dependent DNA helicase RecQ
MLFKIFQYPIPSPYPLDDLNHWLASHRVISVKQEIVTTENTATLVFVVQSQSDSVQPSESRGTSRRDRVDYKTLLDENEFLIFDALRKVRQQIAESEAIPLYAIINNAQLAQMVRLKCTTLGSLDAIDGFGTARIEKYGARLLEVIAGFDSPDPST